MNGPKVGEIWEVACRPGLKYLGVGRDLTEDKWLVFQKPDGNLFLLTKDEFYSPDTGKRKEL